MEKARMVLRPWSLVPFAAEQPPLGRVEPI
jgi:hypothetical protein